MPSFESLRASYLPLWRGMTINPDRLAASNATAKNIVAGKVLYQDIEQATGVPWFFIGLVHLREGSLNFSTYLGNGQPLSKVTTIVPKGRGPFLSFKAGAMDALDLRGLTTIHSWPLERIAFELEGYNGYGYRSRGVNSPYLWSGTNRYTKGKYVADGVYDPNAVDKQLGVMAVLSSMCALDAEVNARINSTPIQQPAPPDIPKPAPQPPTPAAPASSGWLSALLSALAAVFKRKA